MCRTPKRVRTLVLQNQQPQALWPALDLPSSVLVRVNRNRIQIFCLENLAAIEAFHVIHTVPAGDEGCFYVITGCSHTDGKLKLIKRIIILEQQAAKGKNALFR